MIRRNNYEIDFVPEFDEGQYDFIEGTMTEEYGGFFPTLELTFTRTDGFLEEEMTEVSFVVSSQDKATLRFSGYVLERNFTGRNITYTFVLLPRPFVVREVNRELGASLDDSLDILSSGINEVRKNTISNVFSQFYQINESSYKTLQKLLFGYNKDVIFSFNASEININDIRKPSIELPLVSDRLNVNQLGQVITTGSRFTTVNEVLSNVGDSISKVNFDKYHSYHDSQYQTFYSNYLYNIRHYTQFNLVHEIGYSGLFPYSCGDKLVIENPIINRREFLITKKITSFSSSISTFMKLADYTYNL